MSSDQEPGRQDKPDQKQANTTLASGMAFGLALGAGFGLLLDNLAIGVGIGLALGVAMATWVNNRKPGDPKK